MTSRALAAALIALSLAGCASDPPDGPRGRGGPGGPDRPARGFSPSPGETGENGPRPPRNQLFISPAGEPFRAPAEALYPMATWFSGADANHDGAISRDEFVADAARFFAVLDTDKDGVIDGFEVSTYEKKMVPEILLGGGMGGGGGGGRGGPPGGGGGPPGGGPDGEGGPRKRAGLGGSMLTGATPYSLLAEPQPVMGADGDFNRRITKDEALKAAKARFALLDTNKDGVLKLEEQPPPRAARQGGPGDDRKGLFRRR